jgi:hypothetical protein
MVVIPQPDGSVACIPAWMTHESAAHHQLRPEPRLSLDILRSLRAEIDEHLRCLQSDSGMENANNEAQEGKHSAGPVRTGSQLISRSLRRCMPRHLGSISKRPARFSSSHNMAPIAFWASVFGLTGQVRRHLINVLD